MSKKAILKRGKFKESYVALFYLSFPFSTNFLISTIPATNIPKQLNPKIVYSI